MAVVMIGVDPHEASHTAVAVGADEQPLGQVRVRASAVQGRRLVVWAAAWPQRSWAVEGAGGLGHLLARQLVAAGERVLDVQPKLAARVRLLADEAVNKNDPNDARTVAVTALRSRTAREVVPDDRCAVLKMWSRRYHDLGSNRTRAACRLHAALCELVPGGIGKEITVAAAAALLEQVTPSGAVQQARRDLAAGLLDDLRRADEQLHRARQRLAEAVQATGTSLTGMFGAGPFIAATVIGEAGDVSRFTSRDAFASCNGTAPIEVSSGKRKVYRLSLRGNRRLNHAAHMAAVTQVRYPRSQGRAYYDKKIAEGKTAKEALRALKRQVSDAFYKHLKADAARAKSPGGQAGNDSVASAAGSHPKTPVLRPGHSRTKTDPTPTPIATEQPQFTGPQEDQRPHLTQRGVDLGGWSVFGVIEEIAQNGSICQLGRRSRNKCYQQRSPCGLRLPGTITDWPGGSPTATAFTVPWWPVSGASTGSPDSRL